MFGKSEERHIYEALLRFNYFPNQKETVGEIPPCFNSKNFTPEIADFICADTAQKARKQGYDCIEYSSTRYNNFPRVLSIIHPKPYSLLVQHIYKNWGQINNIKDNPSSMIKPEIHTDGRILIMNYEDSETKTIRELNDGFGCRFKVKTDIAGCFNNIYSHAIPWAAIGINNAKINASKNLNANQKHWSDQLDFFQRNAKRNETHGIPIGPATSSIVSEIILKAVDDALNSNGFVFRRYIDDYTCFCKTYEEAQNFLHILGVELAKYKLSLNLHKTKITQLPDALNDSWVSHLTCNSPIRNYLSDKEMRKLSSAEVINFLDYAVHLHQERDGGSILKYAVSLIVYQIKDEAFTSVFDYLINLSWHYPILMPYLGILIDNVDVSDEVYNLKFNSLLKECVTNKRSDGVAWLLYFCFKKEISLKDEILDEIIDMKDCLSLCILDDTNLYEDKIKTFVTSITDLQYDYDIDRYWLLFYQRFYHNKDSSPYQDKCFDILKKYNVNFMPKEGGGDSPAEKYCAYLNNPFRDANENVLPLDQWLKSEKKPRINTLFSRLYSKHK